MPNVNNKVNYGLCSMYYAIVTDTAGVISYGTPVALPGSVNFSATPRGDVTEFEADDVIYFRAAINSGYDVELGLANIPDEFFVSVLGDTDDVKKVMIEKTSATIKRVALLGQFDGDAHKKRFVLYNCLPERPNFDSKTSRKKEPIEKTLKLVCDPLASGTVKATTKQETDATVYGGWFSAVYTETTGG